MNKRNILKKNYKCYASKKFWRFFPKIKIFSRPLKSMFAKNQRVAIEASFQKMNFKCFFGFIRAMMSL
jgi:hypothetical protein